MYLSTYKPLTPGARFVKSIAQFNFIKFFKKRFYCRKLLNAGKNNSGQTTVYHRGGCKQTKFCILPNYSRRWSKQLSILVQINSGNSFSNIFLGLIKYTNGSYSYISLQHGCFVGQIFQTAYLPLRFFMFYTPGNLVPLKFLNLQSVFSNVISVKKSKGNYCKSAGTYCRIWKKQDDLNIVTVILPTKKKKHFSGDTFVTLGRNSNIIKYYTVVGKAGKNRLQGIRSHVRGVAMNPVDHPHGGRTKSNSPEVSLWGWVTKKNH